MPLDLQEVDVSGVGACENLEGGEGVRTNIRGLGCTPPPKKIFLDPCMQVCVLYKKRKACLPLDLLEVNVEWFGV